MMAILINFVLIHSSIGRKEKDQVNSTTYPNGESSQNVPKAALRFLGAQVWLDAVCNRANFLGKFGVS